ncbi:YadA C-terminal domain-containing protein [Sneathia vaginalis]|uniref:YadA C-terminal domain-containing protein n=2 Tax=Sneathia TaxID=168808 RepID=UPI00254FDCE2|nr:YadA C-terminal domain-containing protein [Sneathia vaginalis]MDK9582386.1 YadA C-terminal domain-containing protein [Sneathia vaginalis]
MNNIKTNLTKELTEKTNSAKEEITQAVTQATTTATEAKASIDTAKQEIQTATQKVNEAKTSAENFSKTAATKAEEAKTAADTATQKANEAKADADRAIQTKNESLSIANNVKDDLAKFKDEYTAKLNALDMKTDLALNGSAAAIAIGNLGSISSNSNRQFQLSAAYGFFGGKHAVALGFSGISNNDRFTYRLSGAVTGNGNLAFGAGAGILFGEKRNTNANYEQLKKEIEELRRMINNR